MKLFNYIALSLSILAAVVEFVVMIAWGVSLPSTALLWINGALSGWIELIVVSTCAAGFCLVPAVIMIAEIRGNK